MQSHSYVRRAENPTLSTSSGRGPSLLPQHPEERQTQTPGYRGQPPDSASLLPSEAAADKRNNSPPPPAQNWGAATRQREPLGATAKDRQLPPRYSGWDAAAGPPRQQPWSNCPTRKQTKVTKGHPLLHPERANSRAAQDAERSSNHGVPDTPTATGHTPPGPEKENTSSLSIFHSRKSPFHTALTTASDPHCSQHRAGPLRYSPPSRQPPGQVARAHTEAELRPVPQGNTHSTGSHKKGALPCHAEPNKAWASRQLRKTQAPRQCDP